MWKYKFCAQEVATWEEYAEDMTGWILRANTPTAGDKDHFALVIEPSPFLRHKIGGSFFISMSCCLIWDKVDMALTQSALLACITLEYLLTAFSKEQTTRGVWD